MTTILMRLQRYTLTGALLGLTLAACTPTATEQPTKPVVTVSWWGSSLVYGLQPLLIETFPEVEFQFLYSNNSTEFFKFKAEQGCLPDILTVRRFSLRDALELKDQLVDLSETDLATKFYQNYLTNYTFEDGVINWLPAVAECQTLLVNKSLFEQYHIDLPTDYQKFRTACKKLRSLGIIPLAANFEDDFESLEMLQGFNAAAMQSVEGKRWRLAYESGLTDHADSALWQPMFDRMYDVIRSVGMKDMLVRNENGEIEAPHTYEDSQLRIMIAERKLAMIRRSGNFIVNFEKDSKYGDEFILLPYPGDTEDFSWIETYPYYQAAISRHSKVDQKLLRRIYDFIFSPAGQGSQGYSANTLSYTNDYTVTLGKGMESVADARTTNHLYIRLANNDMFAASKRAVQAMIMGEADAREAYQLFDAMISAPHEEPVRDVTFDRSYPYTFDAQHGCQSSSAVLNTCREEWGVDLAVMFGPTVNGDITACSIPADWVKYLCSGEAAYTNLMTLTGAQLKSLVSKLTDGWEGEVDYLQFRNNTLLVPHLNSQLPVSSGFEMQVTSLGKGRYHLDGLTIGGQEIDDDRVFSVAYAGFKYSQSMLFQAAGLEYDPQKAEILPKVQETLYTRLVEQQGQLTAPTDYITLKYEPHE